MKELKDTIIGEIVYMIDGFLDVRVNKYKVINKNTIRDTTILQLCEDIKEEKEKELINYRLIYKVYETKIEALKEIESVFKDHYIKAKKVYDKARKKVIEEERKIREKEVKDSIKEAENFFRCMSTK